MSPPFFFQGQVSLLYGVTEISNPFSTGQQDFKYIRISRLLKCMCIYDVPVIFLESLEASPEQTILLASVGFKTAHKSFRKLQYFQSNQQLSLKTGSSFPNVLCGPTQPVKGIQSLQVSNCGVLQEAPIGFHIHRWDPQMQRVHYIYFF